jgi:hypothetical protein
MNTAQNRPAGKLVFVRVYTTGIITVLVYVYYYRSIASVTRRHLGPPYQSHACSAHLHLQTIRTMDKQQDIPVPGDVTFRVLIIGRANAGKTSILQRVCGTTESPEIYTVNQWGDRM